jgi:hypothetical protein
VLSYRETSHPNESAVNYSAVSDGSVRPSYMESSLLMRSEAKDDASVCNTSRPSVSFARSKTDSIAESDVTSSTVIRETDIRFLNDFAVRRKPAPTPAARVHRVNVVVPTAHSSQTPDNAPSSAHNAVPFVNDVHNAASCSVPSQSKLKVTFEDMKPSEDAELNRRVATAPQSSADMGEIWHRSTLLSII